MKACAIALALIVIIGFSVIGIIIYSAFPHDSKKVWFILHTNNMLEADSSAGDSVAGPVLIAGYFTGKRGLPNVAVPAADVYICVSRNKLDTSKKDTALLLDTRLLNGSGELAHPEYYGVGVKPAKKLKECQVMIPENLIKKLRNYKYRYGMVQLITDD
jgi:hypothetical protein